MIVSKHFGQSIGFVAVMKAKAAPMVIIELSIQCSHTNFQ